MSCNPQIVSSLTTSDYWVECPFHEYKSPEFVSMRDVSAAMLEHMVEGGFLEVAE